MSLWDLNVNASPSIDIIEHAIKLGYQGVAWNHHVESITAKDTCTIERVSDDDVKLLHGHNPPLSPPSVSAPIHPQFQQLTRITVQVDELSQINTLQQCSAVLKSYDLVAVVPASEKVLHQCVHYDLMDIITFDYTNRLPFFLKLTPLKMAIERGIMIEVVYDAAMLSSSSRKHLITTCLQLIFLTKGKNLVISSGTKTVDGMKSPHDIIALGLMLGFPQDVVYKSMTSHCYQAMMHAATRQTYKASVQFLGPPHTFVSSNHHDKQHHKNHPAAGGGNKRGGQGQKAASKQDTSRVKKQKL